LIFTYQLKSTGTLSEVITSSKFSGYCTGSIFNFIASVDTQVISDHVFIGSLSIQPSQNKNGLCTFTASSHASTVILEHQVCVEATLNQVIIENITLFVEVLIFSNRDFSCCESS
jgi:hypothetical protein